MSQEDICNLEEGKLPIDYKDNNINLSKKLGIILEENIYNNEMDKSIEYSKEDNNNNSQNIYNNNLSDRNYTVKLQINNNMLFKENEEEKDIKYNSFNNLSNNKINKLNNSITNNSNNNDNNNSFLKNSLIKDSLYNNNKEDNNEKYKGNNNNNQNELDKNNINNNSNNHSKYINENNNNAKDIIILDSDKKQSELIKLLSSNKLETIRNDRFTKNINLNININNNIQYEIEKNKNKEEVDNNELNKSLNSLIKIAEKNCICLNDSIGSSVYTKNRPILNNKMKGNNSEKVKEKNEKMLNNYSTLDNHKRINRDIFDLSLGSVKKVEDNKKQIFKRVKSQNIIENKNDEKNNNNIEDINVINDINEDENKNKNNNILILDEFKDSNTIYEKRNIFNNKNYNKKHDSSNYNSIKNNNKNFNIIKKDNYNNIKNYFSIDKSKTTKYGRQTVSNFNKCKNNIINKEEDESLYYQNSVDKNYNTNYSQSKEKIFGRNKGFFEVNISLNNYLNNENIIEESNYKIYKRPTMIYPKKIIRKGKSVDKIINNINNINIDQENPIIKRIKQKKVMNRTKTFNTIDSKDKNIITYKKKNPYNQENINNIIINNNNKNQLSNIKYKHSFNNNHYLINNRNYNTNNNINGRIIRERNTINNFKTKSKSPIDNYNIKKYNDIYDINNNKNIYNKKNNIIALNIEELLVLEEKLSEIIIEFKKKKKADNQCFDFLNYYFNFSLYEKIEKIFKNETEEEIVRLSLNYKLMSILICYIFSLSIPIKSNYVLIMEILQICHRNLTLIYEEILKKITHNNNNNNKWVLKLNETVQYSKNSSDQLFSTKNNYFTTLISKIDFNINSLIKKIKNIIYNNNDLENRKILLDFVLNLNQKTYEEINDFFREYIYKVDNLDGSIFSSLIDNNIDFPNRVYTPYIREPNLKKYSLVLDLNETLINFTSTKDNQGLLRTRPFLFEFLDSISQYYEIILFTCSTQNYTESIVKKIEYKKKYFDYIFCRQHTIIIKNDFVKDLTRIGRSLDSIIIIDNMPQNFRLQKENAINIKSFWGDNSEDTALYDLIPILINIAKEKGDVREQLKKYRDEIITKITSIISMNNV